MTRHIPDVTVPLTTPGTLLIITTDTPAMLPALIGPRPIPDTWDIAATGATEKLLTALHTALPRPRPRPSADTSLTPAPAVTLTDAAVLRAAIHTTLTRPGHPTGLVLAVTDADTLITHSRHPTGELAALFAVRAATIGEHWPVTYLLTGGLTLHHATRTLGWPNDDHVLTIHIATTEP